MDDKNWIFESDLIDEERNEADQLVKYCHEHETKDTERMFLTFMAKIFAKLKIENDTYNPLVELIFDVFVRCRGHTCPKIRGLELTLIDKLDEWGSNNQIQYKALYMKYKPLFKLYQPKSLTEITLKYIRTNLDNYEFNIRILTNDLIYRLIKLI